MMQTHSREIRKIAHCVLAFLAVGASLAFGAEPLSVALVGDGYGKYEVNAIAKNVLNELDDICSYQVVEGRLGPEEFGQYDVGVLARTVESYGPGESREIEKYVTSGGTLVLIGVSPRSLFIVDVGPNDGAVRMRNDSFLFGSTVFEEGGKEASVFQPDSPLLKDVFAHGSDPLWMMGTVFLPNPDWENIIGHNQNILVGRTSLGKGSVYFFGSELFRLIKAANDAGRPEDVQGWIQILKNLFRQAALSPHHSNP